MDPTVTQKKKSINNKANGEFKLNNKKKREMLNFHNFFFCRLILILIRI